MEKKQEDGRRQIQQQQGNRHTQKQRREAEEEIAKAKKESEGKTRGKSTRGSQEVRGDGQCKRIITLISGGKIEVVRVAALQQRARRSIG